MNRFNPDIHKGLTEKEVNIQLMNNLSHKDTGVKTKTVKEIVLSNIFTLFNGLNLFLGLLILSTGEIKNLLFLGVVFCNTVISMYQEIHAKRIVDKLSIIASTKVNIIRDGNEEQHSMNDIVLDDIISYSLGNQVIVDSIIKEGCVEVDESFLTGEADPIQKEVGDMLLSGSFIVAGKCLAKVEHIGDDNYTSKISKEAKYIKKVNSEIMYTMNKIIKWISIVIIPIGLLLFMQQMHLPDATVKSSIVNTVAAVIGMIPEGLILLTSTVLAVGSIRLARKHVLVQELYCIETLARVDTICFDKTGTLTEGKMEVVDLITIDKSIDASLIMQAIAYYSEDNNPTSLAIKKKYVGESNYKKISSIPFSSKRKYSSITLDIGTFNLGAPEFLTNDDKVLKMAHIYKDNRVLLLTKGDIDNGEAVAFLLIRDKIHKSAKRTLDYFKNQKVDIKIISGDSVDTICQIAKRVGLDNVRGIDMSTVSDINLDEIVEKYNIFGRVSPSGKKDLIMALKRKGHTVAMMGDGVNDCLALKEADCSLAPANGSDAARSVSQLILMDSNFTAIPKIVNEGRRSINNLERSATLFLSKTMYASLLAILFLFINRSYPFEPIQLSLTNMVAIGIPSFILALEPNNDRIQGTFIINVIRKAIPASLTVIINIISVMVFTKMFSLGDDFTSTMAVFLLAFSGFQLLFRICYPFNLLRGVLFGGLIGIFFGGTIGLRTLFDLVWLQPGMMLFVIVVCILDILLFISVMHLCEKKIFKYEERIVK